MKTECLNCQNDFDEFEAQRFDGFCCVECEVMYKAMEEEEEE